MLPADPAGLNNAALISSGSPPSGWTVIWPVWVPSPLNRPVAIGSTRTTRLRLSRGDDPRIVTVRTGPPGVSGPMKVTPASPCAAEKVSEAVVMAI